MTISQLIEKLEAIRAEHGDLEITAWPYDGQEPRFWHIADCQPKVVEYVFSHGLGERPDEQKKVVCIEP